MRLFIYLLCISLVSYFFSGCDLVNPAEKTPTFLNIDSFQFVPTSHTGTQSHQITAVFAYLDGAPLGAFDLPARIPVLSDKKGLILVKPAVIYSGLKDVVVPYPYYKADTMTFVPEPLGKKTWTPRTGYLTDSLMNIVIEDFESGNAFVPLQGDTLGKTSDPQYVFEGTYGGLIRMNNSNFSENILSQTFTGKVSDAYLELNYKGTLSFVIGVQAYDGTNNFVRYLYGFYAHETWNKVYVGLSDFLTLYPNMQYRILVKIAPSQPVTGYVAFDNFKVITK